ncbi:MAG TPA: adenylate/guanylate cyclase domain-containing protein, partial [Acidimicrobiia bacterium]
KLLVVDDEAAVHDVTRLALAAFSFEGRPLRLLSAYSAAEAEGLLADHPDTAVILLDVVMETDGAGLDFVHHVRTVERNHLVRIILRTGQPGHAPENRVIVEYDINDYKHKADLTSQRLFTSVIGALRSYRDLRYISDFSQALRRFVPEELTRILGKRSIVDVVLGDHVEGTMGVVFSDLRAFTTLSEQLSPDATFRFLNDYLKEIGPVTRAHGGYIDKYVGDAILAIFPDGPDDALQAALAMQRQVDVFNRAREAAGEPPVTIGVGVHSGPLVLGIIGESERLEGTVIADSVNLACRLEGLCKDFGVRIVTTEECLAAAKDAAAYATRFLGELPVRGKAAPVRAYELVV